jgi:hypothetical protein
MAELQRRSNFVAPAPAPIQRIRVEPEPWPVAPQLPDTTAARYNVTGTPTQHAAAFGIAYAPFAVSAALVASVVAAVAGGSVAVVAIVTLSVLSITWLAGFVVSTVVSAAGADLAKVLLTYRFLRHEQRHRHAREGDR